MGIGISIQEAHTHSHTHTHTRARTHARTHTHTHPHPFNGPFSETTRVSQYQKGKTNLDFTEARDSEWQWHQLGRMQVCISLQTDNPTTQVFLQPGCPSCRPTNSDKALNTSIQEGSHVATDRERRGNTIRKVGCRSARTSSSSSRSQVSQVFTDRRR